MLGNAGWWKSIITGSIGERHGQISRARLLKCELTCDHRLYEDVLDTPLLLRASSNTVQERQQLPVRSSIRVHQPVLKGVAGWLGTGRVDLEGPAIVLTAPSGSCETRAARWHGRFTLDDPHTPPMKRVFMGRGRQQPGQEGVPSVQGGPGAALAARPLFTSTSKGLSS
eukprot:scaffold2118_cov391-Prasinococcus_capsulatus_cf.AAC.3